SERRTRPVPFGLGGYLRRPIGSVALLPPLLPLFRLFDQLGRALLRSPGAIKLVEERELEILSAARHVVKFAVVEDDEGVRQHGLRADRTDRIGTDGRDPIHHGAGFRSAGRGARLERPRAPRDRRSRSSPRPPARTREPAGYASRDRGSP